MTQFSTFNVELFNSQLKPSMQNGTEQTNLSTNLIGSFNDATNFPHKLLIHKFKKFVKLLQMVHQLI